MSNFKQTYFKQIKGKYSMLIIVSVVASALLCRGYNLFVMGMDFIRNRSSQGVVK